MKLLTLSDLKHFWTNAVQKIPIKISDLQDDVDMLTSHEDLHLEDLPNESPNIRFINNSPQVTWNEHVYYDPATTLISGPSYEFDDETSLTSKSKIGYTNSSNSQNTVEHIYGQTYGTTKAFFTMKYYYGSNEKNAEEDESCTINSSLVFTLDPNYNSAGADTYYDESNAYSDVSPNNENYFIGRYRPFKEIRAKDFKIALDGYDFSLSSGFDDIYTHTEDTDIHVTASDKTTWNTVTSKANDNAVVHNSGAETVAGIKTFSDGTYIKSLNFTNEVASTSSSSSAIMPIITTITYSDSSPSVQARLNLRVTASGDKSLYPHENLAYSLGLASRSWSDFYSYHGYFRGQQQNDEYSGNARTNLTLLANRDTIGTSGCLIDTFRENTSQGTGMHILGFGIKENSVRYEGLRIQWVYDDVNLGYDLNLKPNTQGTNKPLTYNLGTSVDQWSKIFGLKYYYGSNNTEFSDKFITTDTNQTITSNKTFVGSQYFKDNNVQYFGIDFSKGTAPSGYTARCTYFSPLTGGGSTYQTSNGLIGCAVNNDNVVTTFMHAIKNTAGTTTKTSFVLYYDTDNDKRSVTTNGDFLPILTGQGIGNSTSKWSTLNGVVPSALSLPDIDNRIDISSYITDLTGVNNEYTPTVNGWICVRSGNATKISILDSGTNIGNQSLSNTATYLTVMTPCIANKKVYINVVCTSLSFAVFIPCLGNV